MLKFHDCRCNKCKSVIYAMLFRIYDDLEFCPKFDDVSVQLEAYKEKPYYEPLSKIYDALVNYRGCKDFVKSRMLNQSDLYIPTEKILIETDEKQHFSEARVIALENYPKDFQFDYDSKLYKSKCSLLQAKSSNSKHREEQRAWYDTIRDFLPMLRPDLVKKVVRIPLVGYPWCSLNHKDEKDRKKFKELLKSEEIWMK